MQNVTDSRRCYLISPLNLVNQKYDQLISGIFWRREAFHCLLFAGWGSQSSDKHYGSSIGIRIFYAFFDDGISFTPFQGGFDVQKTMHFIRFVNVVFFFSGKR